MIFGNFLDMLMEWGKNVPVFFLPNGYRVKCYFSPPPKKIYIYNISKGLQCALTAITIVAVWRFLHLGRRMCAYTLFGLHCEVTRVLKLRTVSDA